MKLFKYRSLERMDYALDIILNEQLYCPEYTDLNDPFEGIFMTYIPDALHSINLGFTNTGRTAPANLDYLVKESLHKRVCSLSSDLHDVRLWSHYAGGHRGIAIEIEFPDDDTNILQVQYSEKLPHIATGLLSNEATERNILTKKTIHWSYESEYRIITDQEYYSIKGMVKAVYLGIGISEFHKQILESIAVPFGLMIYQAYLDHDGVKIVHTSPPI